MGFKGFIALLAVMSLTAAEEVLIPGLGYYSIPDMKLHWDEAMTSCWFNGGHLAIINSELEAQVLGDLVKQNVDSSFAYIGFQDIAKEGYYVTVTDIPLKKTGYSDWASNYPNRGASTNCGAINVKGELADLGCRQILNYICERELWTGYDLVPEHGYYKLYSEELTWGEALERCHQEDASLVVINSDEEAAVVAALFQNTTSTLAHVGLHDQYKEAFFFTLHGQKIEDSGYNKWTYYEPYKDSEINYVAVDNEGLYHMVNATYKLPFICEHAL